MNERTNERMNEMYACNQGQPGSVSKDVPCGMSCVTACGAHLMCCQTCASSIVAQTQFNILFWPQRRASCQGCLSGVGYALAEASWTDWQDPYQTCLTVAESTGLGPDFGPQHGTDNRTEAQ